jgi:hypothetical protein
VGEVEPGAEGVAQGIDGGLYANSFHGRQDFKCSESCHRCCPSPLSACLRSICFILSSDPPRSGGNSVTPRYPEVD